MTDLQFIHCINCDKQWLVGINGHDIRGSRTSGSEFMGIPFMAIGNEEIDESRLPDQVPCNICETLCKVESRGEKRS